jgi:hypothetical protein
MFMPRMVWAGIDDTTIPVALCLLLRAFTDWNVYTMRRARDRGVPAPPLYAAARAGLVRYIEEDYTSTHPEDWLDWREVLRQGGGDCEDLAAYRAAELQLQGEHAQAMFHRRVMSNGSTMIHIIVQRGNGRLEDPSRLLGMPG